MEITQCVGPGIVSTRPPETPAANSGIVPPETPLVTPCGVSTRQNKRVNVGVAGETPLETREMDMTPNEERKKRTWQPNKYGAALAMLEEAADEEIDSGRTRSSSAEEDPSPLLPLQRSTSAAPSKFRHRDSLMIAARHIPPPSPGLKLESEAECTAKDAAALVEDEIDSEIQERLKVRALSVSFG